MRILYTLILTFCCAFTMQAQTNWTGAVDTDWNNDLNWTANAPTTGMTATILASPNDPVISSDLNIDFIVQNFATVTFDANVVNNGTILNFGPGTIINNAEFINSTGQTFQNNGQFFNNNLYVNEGIFTGSGMGQVENAAGAIFQNQPGAIIQNFAMISNHGMCNNDGQISNFDVFDNFNEVINYGTLGQGVDGIFNNYVFAILENNGIVANGGDIVNNLGGLIVNNNEFTNFSNGGMINHGDIDNYGQLTNAGIYINGGILSNSGTFTNDFGADLGNTGSIRNNACATFFQFTANPIAAGFINNGILYQIPGAGNVAITGGTGVALDDINDFPAPEAICKAHTVILDDEGNGSITSDDINNGSFANYCEIVDLSLSKEAFTCANKGANIVLLTVTDALGFSDFCAATVTVVDNEVPVIHCQNNIYINLGPGECDAIVHFNKPTAFDNCGATVSQIDNTGFQSGDVFPAGVQTIIFEANDGTNSVTCSFNVNVIPFQDPDNELFCNGLGQVALNKFCQATIGADDILEGGPYACYESYIVDVNYTGSNTVDGDDVGQILTVTVTDASIGNSCWGTIEVVDHIAPVITCENKTISCLENAHPDFIGYPASQDNCDDGIFPLFEDEILENGCDGSVITRTWTVSDFSGNTNSCEQTLTVIRPSLGNLVYPPNRDDLEAPALDCTKKGLTDPDITGWPRIKGVDITNICDFYSSYEDIEYEICEGSIKIVRYWEVFDWCTGDIDYHTQIIKLLDKTPPTIDCPEGIDVSVGQYECFATVILPDPAVNDDCGIQIDVEISTSTGILNGHVLSGLTGGTHTVTYTATDDCDNEMDCTIEIYVNDEVPPVVVCEETHTIGLTVDEPTLVAAIVFDDGSYDHCGELTYKVRRMDNAQCPDNDATLFGDYSPFYCCDIGNPVMVELKVTDVSGISNSCMVEVIVDDKINPAIQCPPDQTLECYDDFNDLSLTGEAIADDNCGAIVTYSQTGDLDNCGGGLVVRTWTATDPGGRAAFCDQKIYVLNNAPYYITDTDCNNNNPYDGVIWPCDYETPVCDAIADPSIAGEPTITEDGCDLVAYTYEDIVFPITPPACIKILRKWTVIDWCQYDQPSGYGLWSYTQVIKILNTTAPEFTSNCETQFFCSYEEDCGPAPVTLTTQATDDCTGQDDINYYFEIDLGNNGIVDITGSGNDASDDFDLGTHSIKWFAEDGCGNVAYCEYLFIVEDCKKPTPYCINGLAVELMPNSGMVAVWASDFDQGSYDNCGVDELRIASPAQGPGQTTPPAPGAHSVTFDCWNEGTNTVDLWVKDVNGNWDYCATYIIVQDNQQVCNNGTATSTITGSINNENGDFIQDVTVTIDGDMNGLPDPEVTGAEGIYAFPWLPVGHEFAVLPEKDMNPLNGVTTFDLVLITKHILQIQTLDSPYKLIAGDINASGSITAFDIVFLRRLILTIDEGFTSNTSWRFVDADFVFPDPANPWATPFPEIYEINDLGSDENADFVAIKIGDVNTTAIPNSLVDQGDDRNTENPVVFNVEDKALEAGKTYQVDFTTQDFNNTLGYQFTLDFDKDKIRVETVQPGQLADLSQDNFGIHQLESGLITTSWNRSSGYHDVDPIENGLAVFSLQISALQDVALSEALQINSTLTKAEAYTSNEEDAIEITDVHLAFTDNNNNQHAGAFQLYPNQPNPFINQTLIRFELPENTPLALSIQDLSGKVLKVINGNFEAGYNEINIQKEDLNGNGVYFYTLMTKSDQASGKMILIQR